MGIRLVASLLVALVLPLQAWATTQPVRAGDPAKADGICLDQSAAERIEQDLQSGDRAKVESAIQAEQIVALQDQVRALTREADARERAMAIAEDRDARRQETEARLLTILGKYEQLLDRAETQMDHAQRRIDALESRQWWGQVLGVLGPLGMAMLLLF